MTDYRVINRSGKAIGRVTVTDFSQEPPTAAEIETALGAEPATIGSGSFSCNLSGMDSTVTGTINWTRTGGKVRLYAPSAITGTSNATTMNLSGIPDEIVPARTQHVTCWNLLDNGSATNNMGRVIFTAGANSASLSLINTSGASAIAAVFTAANSKGLDIGWSVEYDCL